MLPCIALPAPSTDTMLSLQPSAAKHITRHTARPIADRDFVFHLLQLFGQLIELPVERCATVNAI